jgi:hypothetical protein
MKTTDTKNYSTKNLNVKRNIYTEKSDNSSSNISIGNNNKIEAMYKYLNNPVSNISDKNNFSKLNKLYNKEFNFSPQRTQSKNKK